MKELVSLLCLLLYLHYSSSLGEENLRPKRKVNQDKRIVCYYSSWATYRTGESKFTPEDIHPNLCTHVLYAFATLEKDVGVVPFDGKQDIGLEGYAKFIELKKINPELQLMLAVGGTKEGSSRFSKIAADPEMRMQFAKNARVFLKQFGFDGLDLVWQYPVTSEGSSSSDKENYVKLVMDIKNEFKDDYWLSMAVPSSVEIINKGFDLPELTKYLDFMNVLNYNYHVASEPTVNHLAPLYSVPTDPSINKDLNVDFTVRTYLSMGVDPAKLNMGIPLYSVSFALEDPDVTDIGSLADDEGPGLQEFGSGIYNDFCKKIKDERWTVIHANRTAMGPYAYKDSVWIAYDDEEMIRNKGKYAAEKKLGGLMFWSIDMDDFKGLCHTRAFPLIKAGREAFLSKPRPPSSVTPRPTPAATPRPTPQATPRPTPQATPTPTPQAAPRPKPRVTPRPTLATVPTRPSQDTSLTERPEGFSGNTQKQRPGKPFTDRPSTNTPRVQSSDTNAIDSDTSNTFPELDGTKTFNSNRDIVFQNIRIWVTNHFYNNRE